MVNLRGCRKSLSGQVEGDKLGLLCGMKVISELLQRSTAVSSRCWYCYYRVITVKERSPIAELILHLHLC